MAANIALFKPRSAHQKQAKLDFNELFTLITGAEESAEKKSQQKILAELAKLAAKQGLFSVPTPAQTITPNSESLSPHGR